jgi:tetratricopeptide (TPR) repeat protein
MMPVTDRPHAVEPRRRAVVATPDDADAALGLGNALWRAGRREEAMAAFARAVALRPDHADARNNLGNALVELGRPEAAVGEYRAALASRPSDASLHYNLGNALLAAGRPAEAEPCYRAAHALRADHAGALNNLGNALRDLARNAEAAECYRAVLALQPGCAGAHNNLGSALLAQGQAEAAAGCFAEAVRLQPDYAEACNNLGGTLLALDRADAALPWFRRAVALDAGQVQARFGESLALLALGAYREGWAAYESRWLDPRFCADEPVFTEPRWQGEPLAGRTLLLHAEQGLGDTIQFARYVPLARQRGGRVLLEAQPSLVPLLDGLADAIIARGAPRPPFDLHCPLLSLPLAFGTDLATVPGEVPYLAADPARLAAWRARLGARRRPRIGLAFSGSPEHPEDAARSIPAVLLAPLLAIGAVEFHLVQTEIRPPDAPQLPAGVRIHAERLRDFADTAALVSLLDLVISVDTSVAHLAGALALPVWVLLPRGADFRWLRRRDDSPWYPTARLFRQDGSARWEPVLARVAARLRDFAGT